MTELLMVLVLQTVLAFDLAAQSKPVLIVNPFSAAEGVELPYDLELLKSQLVAELKVMLGKRVAVHPNEPEIVQGAIYTLDAEFTGWRAGNAAMRALVGLGTGREATDIQYRLTDRSGSRVIERRDTVRANFYTQGSGSTGTLAHPIAQKIAERIKDAKLK